MSDRTFKIEQPHMRGKDIEDWSEFVKGQFDSWGIRYPVKITDDYHVGLRSATSALVEAMGLLQESMAGGITPELRTKLRNRNFTDAEKARFRERESYRQKLRTKFAPGGSVAAPIAKILSSSWGYRPPVHDGVDLICLPNAPLFAICDGVIVRADAGGWWGKGAPADPAVRGKGDGIIIVRCTVDMDPFKPDLNFCYGHAESPRVKVGEKVHAGQLIGLAGLANAWHTHFMVNSRANDGFVEGVGDRDPMPFVNYAIKNG